MHIMQKCICLKFIIYCDKSRCTDYMRLQHVNSIYLINSIKLRKYSTVLTFLTYIVIHRSLPFVLGQNMYNLYFLQNQRTFHDMSMTLLHLLKHVTSQHFSSHFKAYYEINTSGKEQNSNLSTQPYFFYLEEEQLKFNIK